MRGIAGRTGGVAPLGGVGRTGPRAPRSPQEMPPAPPGGRCDGLIRMGRTEYKNDALAVPPAVPVGHRGEKANWINGFFRGCSSVVEHQLPKLSVVGSIPITRSKFPNQSAARAVSGGRGGR